MKPRYEEFISGMFVGAILASFAIMVLAATIS